MRDAHGVASNLEFAFLGPLEVRRGAEVLPLGGSKQRAVLGVLLANAGRTLSTASIADAVWDGEPGDRYDATLQVYVSTLRKILGSDGDDSRRVLVTAAPGYRLEVAPTQTDLGRFRALRNEGARQLAGGSSGDAAATLRTALELWRGRVLEDLRELRFAAEAAIPLEDERMRALEARIDADLRTGRHGDVVGELHALVAEEPLRETLWAFLMLALYRSGRQADALSAFGRLQRMLRDELGIEPSHEVQELHLAILGQRADLAVSSAPVPLTQTLQTRADVTAMLEHPGGLVALRGGRTTLGRSPECTIRMDDPEASRVHAEIVTVVDTFMVIDRGSTNGTFVNGEPVTRHVLADGDEISIGSVTLRFSTGT
jgi:DNA-binding SARP family transcriptional activator